MKLVTFEGDSGRGVGAWTEAGIADLASVNPSLSTDMAGLLRGGHLAMDAVRWAADQAPLLPHDSVRLLAPIPKPGKVVCVGQNYMDHCREQGVEPPERPILFAKFNNAVIGPGVPVRMPALSEQIDYEAELAFAIGRTASNVSERDALDYLAGYLCLNDVSARDIQFADKQWTRGKSFDTFCPMGPWLVTPDEIPDPQALGIRCLVNGEVLQDSNTSEILSYISRSITLEPGDVITTGTPNGVGVFRKPPRFLRSGDTVTVSIEGVGELTSPVL
jgi:2-keto-4-pentenoate hydratase/2-oxohepta-3-ene-1,7-dioic acid hydratase in catechol pathway